MAPLVTIAQVQARLDRPLHADEQARVEAYLNDASALVRQAAGIELTTAPEALVPVVVRIVVRALENPYGVDSETVGAFTWRKSTGTSASLAYLTDEDRRDIRLATGALAASAVNLTADLPVQPSDRVHGLGGRDDITGSL